MVGHAKHPHCRVKATTKSAQLCTQSPTYGSPSAENRRMPTHPANAILTRAAREVLRPMGLVQKGRSRVWLDDHGWWVIVVEFQPSGFGVASYLNVGICWLWDFSKDHWHFDVGNRIPGAGASFED